MDESLDYSSLRPDEVEEFATVIGAALHLPSSRIREWIDKNGQDNYRAVRQKGQIVAGLGLIPMAQWFGGVQVPAVGITAVGVSPSQRGSGVGGAMLRRMLAEVHAMGRPLSVLYPATLPLYQRAGYARAGQQITYKLALDSIDVRETALDLVAMEPAHYEQCYHLYDQRARQSAGQLARPDWMWQRVFQQQETPSFRYLLRQGEQAEGYVVLVQGERDASLNVIDVCALTSAAARRLLTFFSTYRSMIEHVTWRGGSLDPLRYVLRDDLRGGMQRQDMITHSIDWMLRIVDVAGALGARGYPPGIHAELHFDLVDDVLPANSGRRVLHIAEGRGHVTPGGEGRIRLHTRDLAALYSGFCAPGERQTIGTLSGPPADLALAGAIFAGPRPWMPDMF